MSEVEKKEALENINNLLDEAKSKIKEAEELSNNFNIPFSWDLSYGMGGTYYPIKQNKLDDEYYESYEYDDGGWYSSTQDC